MTSNPNRELAPPSDPRSLFAILLSLLAAGCGGDVEGPLRVPVSGTVNVDGQPLESGVIRFIPDGAAGGPAASAVITGGKYELTGTDGPVFGHHRVEIEATNHLDFAIDDEHAYAAAVTAGQTPMASNPIPLIYNQRTTLEADVTDGDGHSFDYDLKVAGLE